MLPVLHSESEWVLQVRLEEAPVLKVQMEQQGLWQGLWSGPEGDAG